VGVPGAALPRLLGLYLGLSDLFLLRPLDRPSGEGGVQRERVWDSCLYEGFQREASGHNPSASPGQRVQRFWTHKFGDAFKERFERYGCVGCGRCDRVCPGGIGVHGVMHKVGGQ